MKPDTFINIGMNTSIGIGMSVSVSVHHKSTC